MSRRYSVYLGLIAFLVLVILGRWWLNSGTEMGEGGTAEAAAHGKVFLPEDFRLRVDFDTASVPQRNLFQPQGSASPTRTMSISQAKAAAMPPPDPERNEREVADSELGQFRLLGVVFRAGKGQAYLALKKESVIAYAGDTVLGQFAVDKIAVDAVELRHLKTNTIRRVPVSGK